MKRHNEEIDSAIAALVDSRKRILQLMGRLTGGQVDLLLAIADTMALQNSLDKSGPQTIPAEDPDGSALPDLTDAA